jgi:hypothetical protein
MDYVVVNDAAAESQWVLTDDSSSTEAVPLTESRRAMHCLRCAVIPITREEEEEALAWRQRREKQAAEQAEIEAWLRDARTQQAQEDASRQINELKELERRRKVEEAVCRDFQEDARRRVELDRLAAVIGERQRCAAETYAAVESAKYQHLLAEASAAEWQSKAAAEEAKAHELTQKRQDEEDAWTRQEAVWSRIREQREAEYAAHDQWLRITRAQRAEETIRREREEQAEATRRQLVKEAARRDAAEEQQRRVNLNHLASLELAEIEKRREAQVITQRESQEQTRRKVELDVLSVLVAHHQRVAQEALEAAEAAKQGSPLLTTPSFPCFQGQACTSTRVIDGMICLGPRVM